jgi:hypothetical protein
MKELHFFLISDRQAKFAVLFGPIGMARESSARADSQGIACFQKCWAHV